jgi:type I restriction enzyme S subunit
METSMENIKMERYPVYKDSGVVWLGEIPNHWDQRRVKFQLTYQKGKNPKDFVPEETDWVYLSMEYLRSNQSKIQYIKNIMGCVFVDDDEILLLWDGSNAGEFIRSKKGVLSSTMALITLLNADQNYAWHYLKVIEIQLRESTIGMGIPHVSSDELKNLLFLLPPPEEQTRIATFLDQKTAQIDQAIAQKERLIELLKERRQILIHNAVTRGLNQNVRMKDSGVEWIGMVPEHWEVKRLKYLGEIKYGLGQPPKESENGLPLIRATNIERGNIVENGLIFVDPSDIPWQRDPELKENDIIIVRSGAYTGDSAIIPPKYSGAIAGYDMVMTPISINAKFLAFALLSKYVLNDQLFLLRMRAAQPHLNAEELGETLILLPNEFEQQEIVKDISNFTLKIITAIGCKEAEIEKLKEYKATLINSAVTGKIKI